MAERRMFAKSIIDSDDFLEMPSTARLLYFDLGMRADDDGFINSPKKIMRMTGASEGDMRYLFEKKFVIPFESGVVVIRHWKINNYIRSDRYNETLYKEEKKQLFLDENGSYTREINGMPHGIPNGIPQDNHMVYQRDTQVRLGKDSIGKVNMQTVDHSVDVTNKDKLSKVYGKNNNVHLTDEQYSLLIDKIGYEKTEHYIQKISWWKKEKDADFKDDADEILKWNHRDRTKAKPIYRDA